MPDQEGSDMKKKIEGLKKIWEVIKEYYNSLRKKKIKARKSL